MGKTSISSQNKSLSPACFLRHPYDSDGNRNLNYPKDNLRNWTLKKWCKSSVFYFISCHVKLSHSEKCQSASHRIMTAQNKVMQSTFSPRFSVPFLFLKRKLWWCRQCSDVTVPVKPMEIGECGFSSCPEGYEDVLLWARANLRGSIAK